MMTKIELKKFQTTLLSRQSELEGLIRNREAAAIETSADALDQIQHAVERELALGTLARESVGLRDTRAADDQHDPGLEDRRTTNGDRSVRPPPIQSGPRSSHRKPRSRLMTGMATGALLGAAATLWIGRVRRRW